MTTLELRCSPDGFTNGVLKIAQSGDMGWPGPRCSEERPGGGRPEGEVRADKSVVRQGLSRAGCLTPRTDVAAV